MRFIRIYVILRLHRSPTFTRTAMVWNKIRTKDSMEYTKRGEEEERRQVLTNQMSAQGPRFSIPFLPSSLFKGAPEPAVKVDLEPCVVVQRLEEQEWFGEYASSVRPRSPWSRHAVTTG